MLSYEYVRNFFKENGCELISKEYKRCTEKLDYKCACGEFVSKSFANFRHRKKCKSCVGKKKRSFQEVKDFFEQRGCTLLTETYKNNNQELEYICICGKKSKTRRRNFKDGANCRKCGREKSKKTQQKHYDGKVYFQTEEFKINKKKTNLKKYGVEFATQSKEVKENNKKTCKERYGVEFVSQVEDVKRKSRETCLEKYGVEYCHQSEEVRKKFKSTLMERYGVPSLAYLSRRASKESQKVFWDIYSRLSDREQEKTYFAEHNGEFVKTQIGEGRCFKYDFVNSLIKKCIEYNGKKFHPQDHQKNEEINWCVFHPLKTVKEAREYEAIKRLTIEKEGYDFLVVWDYEFKSDYIKTLEKCMSFLKGKK